MLAVSGTVLGQMEIANEYGSIHLFKNNLKKGETIWIYYDNNGKVIDIEEKKAVIINKPFSDISF